jgi:hypothetical protein
MGIKGRKNVYSRYQETLEDLYNINKLKVGISNIKTVSISDTDTPVIVEIKLSHYSVYRYLILFLRYLNINRKIICPNKVFHSCLAVDINVVMTSYK